MPKRNVIGAVVRLIIYRTVMKFYKQKTEIQKDITLNFFKKLLSDSNINKLIYPILGVIAFYLFFYVDNDKKLVLIP